MNEQKKILSVEAMPFVMLEKLKVKRIAIESLPEPEQKPLFQDIETIETQALQAEINQIHTNIVSQAAREIQDVFTPESLLETAKKIYRKEAVKFTVPDMMLRYLSGFKQALEHEVNSREYGKWTNRFADVDREIALWKSKVSEAFSPEKINTVTCEKIIPGNKSLRWPVDRCKQVDGLWADSWLQDALHSKPILFSSPQYNDKLIEFYNTFYLKEHAKENKTATQQNIEQEKAIEQAKQQPQPQGQFEAIPTDEFDAMREHRESMDYGMRRLREMGRV
ncbi:MAG: hypothetical protein A4E59_00698 [Syntrophorhabdus sp. PtaB.Bin027]|nr:MAG: hypothetical protein A4E59_00698 [Syntrophorhabdus sp. PtaB.Bin027]